MKRIFLLTLLSILIFKGYGQDNIGTPYSVYGIGLQPENAGPYSAMGGVAAALRHKNSINYLNPASYTALDSNRFYFQMGITGEYSYLSTHKENSNYRVAQNAAFNMAFRLYKSLFISVGFTEKSDIGYDLLYTNIIPGSSNSYFNQNIQGEGGLNDIYLGLGWKYKNLSIGLNTSYVFGKIEKRQTLSAMLENSYIIKTSENNRIHDVLFMPGFQYTAKLSPKSTLNLGTSFNFTQKLGAKKEFISYKVNSGTGSSTMMEDLVTNSGYMKYPFRILSGFSYSYKNQWEVAGDYTFQKMSAYEIFKDNQKLNDYHKGAIGLSWQPDELGRYWWQRNKYMMGGYFIQSGIEIKNTNINTYALTFGAQIPFTPPRSGELLLGIAFDLGIRGTEKNGLIQEKFAKLRVNIAFKEFWFMKRKIN
ncbi:MAG: hypothetical protein RR137_02400 [Odoribacter sp.]